MFSYRSAGLAAASNRVAPASALERSVNSRDVLSTGLDELDAVLPDGGLLRGTLCEISGGRSSGKRALAASLCARTITENQPAVWIDGVGGFYPVIALEHGISSLERLIVVRAQTRAAQGPPQASARRDRRSQQRSYPAALRAADILLSAGDALSLLVVDLPSRTVVPQRLLSRLRLGVETSGAALLFITEERTSGHPSQSRRGQHPEIMASLGTFISLRLHVKRMGRCLSVTIAKSKRGRMAHQTMVTIDEPHSVRLDTTV